ncbi:MAG TPA: hypothetical protein VGG64_05645 [Pirellulales bacterium]
MQPHYPRYGLRTILIGIAVLAGGIAWWGRPRTVDWYAPEGTLAAQFCLKRDWRAELIGCGEQAWFLPDGQCFRRQEVVGAVWRDGAFVGPGRYGDPIYPSHVPPDPPTAEYIGWLVRDRIPISTDLPSAAGERFSYP